MSQASLYKFLKGLVFATVLLTPVFYIKWSIYPLGLPRTLLFQALVELILAVWLPLAILDKRFRPPKNALTWSILTFLAAALLATAFGIDPSRSFWSSEERTVGAFALLHAAALGLVLMSLGRGFPWKKLLAASLAVSAFVSVLAFVQLGVPDLLVSEDPGLRPGSTFGNPAFLASYLIFHVFLAAYLYWSGRRSGGTARWFYAAYGAIDLLAIFTSQTRGAFLGLLAGGAFLFLYFLWTSRDRRVRNILAVIGIWALILSGIFLLTIRSSFWSSVPLLNRFQEFDSSDLGLVPRLAALNAAWRGFLERPVLGWGPENFHAAFSKYFDPRTLELGYVETRFDKPHNFLAEYAVTGGLVLLLSYLAFAFFLLRALYRAARGPEEEPRMLAVFVSAALIGYWVQNLFVFDTVGSLLMLFVLAAWAGSENKPEPVGAGSAFPVSPWLLAPGLLGALLLVYFVNFRALRTGLYQYQAFMTLAKNPREGIQLFRSAVAEGGPYRYAARRDFAMAMSEAYFQNPSRIPGEVVMEALAGMEQVARDHYWDAFNHYALVDMYNQASDLDAAVLLPKAEEQARIALAQTPQRQEVYFSLAKTRSLAGKNGEALDLLKKAIDINPRVPDAHFYYGLVAYADGQPGLCFSEIQKALELGRKWRTADEARVSANCFADSGHVPEAIGLYQEALRLSPADIESEVKLGIAYFVIGERAKAKEVLARVVAATDVTRSPAYPDLEPILRSLGLAP